MARKGEIRRILLAIPRGSHGSREEWSGALRYAAQKTDWMPEHIPTVVEDCRAFLRTAFERTTVDGLIITERVYTQNRDLMRYSLGIPTVVLDGNPGNAAPTVCEADDAEISRTAAEVLIKRGFQHFAYVEVEKSNFGFGHSAQRAAAFAKAVRRAGFTAEILPNDDTLPTHLAALPKPVGVMAYNDFVSNQVLDLCRLGRIAVPEQVGLIGVDNDPNICENLRPSLSSVQPDFEMAGYQAARLLDRLMSGKAVRNFRFGVRTVIERDSTRDLRACGKTIAAANAIIRARFCEKLTPDDIAAELRVSVRLLQLRYKQVVEHGIHEELMRLRMEKAADRLRTTSAPVREISMECGFPCVEHFQRLFRKRFGQSPAQWRKAPSGMR